MHEEYSSRVRQRLSEGRVVDAAFDQLLPSAARSKSTLHWTPVAVARLVAMRLAERGARYVLDAGSGPGKFCTVAASCCPLLTFVGIERHASLVLAARELAERLHVFNAHFHVGDALARSWAGFDGFYFFNPFADSGLGVNLIAESGIRGAKGRYVSEGLRVARRLREAPRGSVLVTYHGLGGPIPSTYELASEEDSGSGCLRTWTKTRDREESWFHLDHGAVSRISWDAFRGDRSVSLATRARPLATCR